MWGLPQGQVGRLPSAVFSLLCSALWLRTKMPVSRFGPMSSYLCDFDQVISPLQGLCFLICKTDNPRTSSPVVPEMKRVRTVC